MEIIFSNILQARRLFDEEPRSDQQKEGVDIHNETDARRKFENREKAAAAGRDRGRREGRRREGRPKESSLLRGSEAERTERHCV